jgi:hypothetical protein
VYLQGALLTASSKFVIDLLLEQKHRLLCEIVEKTEQLWASEQITETVVAIGKVLCSAENSLAFVIDLLSNSKFLPLESTQSHAYRTS